MKLFESISCSKGITLNSQIVDLLAIIDKDMFKNSIEEKNDEDLENLQEEKALIVKKEKFLSKVIRFFKKIFKK